ncbi:hypothetical protein QC761_405000 [Podospora bellae-mahoneyi]|uniref:AA1-like domain-containing protein n=1 Tax=Podospora bellae-mahoneyi TaxID=2093777 RepID=A0ABR0FIM2_9PEZI|nr:hypothetical protein QC761_405000 [Podospora bellae-mahoneyi]
MKASVVTLITLLSFSTATPHKRRDGKCGGPPDPIKTCTKTLEALKWTVDDFDFHASYVFTNPAHQNSWGYVNFNVSNDVVPYTASCSASSNQLSDFFYGTVEYACTLAGTGVPAGAKVGFKFSRPAGTLEITETIDCSDKLFSVSGATTLTLSCTDVTTQNPSWTPGQIYSAREIKCAPVDVTIGAGSVTAL